MELGVAALGEQQQQVQARDLVALGQAGREHGGGELVKGGELRDVAGEGVGVPGADRVQGALLVRLAGECQGGRRLWRGGGGRGGRRRRRGEGVEFEEEQLRFGEEGAGVRVGLGGTGGFQLGEDLLELLFGHLGLLVLFCLTTTELSCLGLVSQEGGSQTLTCCRCCIGARSCRVDFNCSSWDLCRVGL